MNLQGFQHRLIIRTQMVKCICSDRWWLDLNHFANDKNVPKLQRKHELQGRSHHNTNNWAILTVTVDTIYKVLNNLPNTLIPFFYCVQHKCIYFPNMSLWVMNHIQSENNKEIQQNLEQKDGKSPELLVEFLFSLNLAFYLFSPWWFSAWHNHLFTHQLRALSLSCLREN